MTPLQRKQPARGNFALRGNPVLAYSARLLKKAVSALGSLADEPLWLTA